MTPPIRSGSLTAALANLRWLLGSRGLAAVLSLIYLAIVTRSLGPAGFGAFALITGIGQTAASIVAFQTWQIILRYGTGHLHEGSTGKVARLIKAALLLDVAGALGGSVLAAVAIVLLGPRFGWEPETQREAFLFCCAVLIAVRSTPIGVLRLYDRFSDAAAGDATIPVVRLLGSLTVLAVGPSVEGFLIAWAASEIASSILYWVLAVRATRTLPWRAHRLSLASVKEENPGIYSFAAATNGGETLSLATRQLPVLLVGYFASPAAAGGYRLAHQLGRSMALVSQLFARSLLPELTRMHAAGSTADFGLLLKRVIRTAAIGGAILLAFILLVGKQILVLVAGADFGPAYPLLVVFSAAAVFEAVGVAFEPALIASGRATLSFVLKALAAVAMVGLMLVLIPAMGPMGAALAVLAGTIIGIALMGIAVRYVLRSTAERLRLDEDLIPEMPDPDV